MWVALVKEHLILIQTAFITWRVQSVKWRRWKNAVEQWSSLYGSYYSCKSQIPLMQWEGAFAFAKWWIFPGLVAAIRIPKTWELARSCTFYGASLQLVPQLMPWWGELLWGVPCLVPSGPADHRWTLWGLAQCTFRVEHSVYSDADAVAKASSIWFYLFGWLSSRPSTEQQKDLPSCPSWLDPGGSTANLKLELLNNFASFEGIVSSSTWSSYWLKQLTLEMQSVTAIQLSKSLKYTPVNNRSPVLVHWCMQDIWPY